VAPADGAGEAPADLGDHAPARAERTLRTRQRRSAPATPWNRLSTKMATCILWVRTQKWKPVSRKSLYKNESLYPKQRLRHCKTPQALL